MRVLGSHLDPQAAKDLSGSGKGKGVILARITFDYRVRLPSFASLPVSSISNGSLTADCAGQKPTFHPDNLLILHKPVQVSAKKMILQASVYSYACAPSPHHLCSFPLTSSAQQPANRRRDFGLGHGWIRL